MYPLHPRSTIGAYPNQTSQRPRAAASRPTTKRPPTRQNLKKHDIKTTKLKHLSRRDLARLTVGVAVSGILWMSSCADQPFGEAAANGSRRLQFSTDGGRTWVENMADRRPGMIWDTPKTDDNNDGVWQHTTRINMNQTIVQGDANILPILPQYDGQ